MARMVQCCRSCGSAQIVPFLSLGMTPIANSLLEQTSDRCEDLYPLGVAFCQDCTLVQLFYELPAGAVFTDDYPYYSSFSDIVTEHGRQHARNLVAQRQLDARSQVVEVASNDGYLLREFQASGVPVLGIDPSPGPALAAQALGVPTMVEFFTADVARRLRAEGVAADVVIANNVMAHVPNLNDFVEGLAILVADDGIITIENPYVRDLVEQGEFDTIYHEHFCYFSCLAVEALMRRHGLCLNDVEYFPQLHGGTLRWTVSRNQRQTAAVRTYLDRERAQGLDNPAYYRDFGQRVIGIQKALMDLLYHLRSKGNTIVAYGAAAKGATLLNATRVPSGLIDYVVDRNIHKQGKRMPGTHLAIRDPETLLEDRPDYVLLLAWNHAEEILRQLAKYRDGGGQFIVPIPKPQIVS